MRLRNGKFCEEGEEAPFSNSDSSHSGSHTTANAPNLREEVGDQAQGFAGRAPRGVGVKSRRTYFARDDVKKTWPSTSNGSPENDIDYLKTDLFTKSAAAYLADAGIHTTSKLSKAQSLAGGEGSVTLTSTRVTTAPTKDVVRPHSRTVLLALKIGAWSLVIMYFVVPAIVKLNPWIMSEIAFLHRIRVPFFVDLTKPQDRGLNGTCNFEIPSTDDVTLGAWHVLPESLQDRDLTEREHYSALLSHGEPIIIYFHGNAGTRAVSHRVALYKVLSKAGYHVIAVDYRGFGDSSGTPSEEGLVEDGLATYDWVKRHARHVPVYFWGHSLGSGVATQAGSRACQRGTPPSGVILDAPFSNIFDAASSHPLATPFRYMPYFTWVFVESLKYNNILFSNEKHIKHITVPILIMHAKDDAVVPFAQGKKLHEAASKGKGAKTAYFIGFEAEHKYEHDNIWKAPDLPRIVRDFMAGKLNS